MVLLTLKMCGGLNDVKIIVKKGLQTLNGWRLNVNIMIAYRKAIFANITVDASEK